MDAEEGKELVTAIQFTMSPQKGKAMRGDKIIPIESFHFR